LHIDAEGGVDGLVAHAEAQHHPTPVALTTTAFARSSLRWLEIGS
jgi:hypothetical protein